jgi:hypothetical protein
MRRIVCGNTLVSGSNSLSTFSPSSAVDQIEMIRCSSRGSSDVKSSVRLMSIRLGLI